jgi:hypothetical protein
VRYEGQTAEGTEVVEIFVSHQTVDIVGVRCNIVVDRAYLDGELIEETFDYYAQDRSGNVWYFGEDSREIEDGEIVSRAGSWEAGVSGALPGILIKAQHIIGDVYAQEFAPGVAEDMAEVVAVNVPVVLSDGRRFTCLQTREFTPLDLTANEFKYYARGVGLVLVETVVGRERVELRESTIDTLLHIDPADFVDAIDNPFFPLTPGSVYDYEGETDEGTETIEVIVTFDTKVVFGVTCTVVEDRVFLDGALVEETFDWYAQDEGGNVWYFGEDSREIEDGEIVSRAGSWEAGVDGAVPGIIMPADPRIGDSYRQEYAAGVAEDLGAVVDLGVTVTVPLGTFEGCLQTLDWNPLAGGMEFKYYAPGIGFVLETLLDGSDRVELIGLVR